MRKINIIFCFLIILPLSACSTSSWSARSPSSKKTNRLIDKSYLKEQSSYHYLLAEMSVLNGKHDQSLLQIKNSKLYDNNNLSLKLREVELLLEKGSLYEGLDQLDILLKVHIKEPSLLSLKAKIYEALKSYKSAEKIYKTLYKTDEVLFSQIRLSFLQKHFKKVIKLATTVRFKKDIFLPETHYYLAKSFEKNNQPKQAEKVYKNSLNYKVNAELFLLFSLADFYKKQNNKTNELRLLLKYKDRVSEPYLVQQRLFAIYLESGKNKKAIEHAEILLEEGIKDSSFQFQVSLLFIEEKQYKKAIILLEQILQSDPHLDKVQFYLGLVYKQTEQIEKAKKAFSKIGPKSSYYKEAISAHYWFLAKEKNWKPAGLLLKNAIAKKEISIKLKKTLMYLLVLHYDEQNKTEQALKSAQKILDIFPNFVDALNYTAYRWAEANINLNKAEALAIKAHKLEPNNAFVIDTLGWVFFKNSKYKQAKNYLELSYSKGPYFENAEHLGDVYKHFNKLKKASLFYSKALHLAKAKDDKNRLKNKLGLLFKTKLKNNSLSIKAKNKIKKIRQPSSVLTK
ncbi:MAG: tetratricopeptide repeat protein [Bdellovibrionales bacterium]|nr:tetratricopeptide repeat protein [Bdellovibrionales bacterium]